MLTTLTTHRHLLVTMVRRELGARFVGTSLGGLWSLIQPAILLGLYTMVFSVIYRVGEIEGDMGLPSLCSTLAPGGPASLGRRAAGIDRPRWDRGRPGTGRDQ